MNTVVRKHAGKWLSFAAGIFVLLCTPAVEASGVVASSPSAGTVMWYNNFHDIPRYFATVWLACQAAVIQVYENPKYLASPSLAGGTIGQPDEMWWCNQAGIIIDTPQRKVGCPANATAQGSTCICDAAFVPDAGATACVCADPNASVNGAACACKAGYHTKANVCVPDCTAAMCGGVCKGGGVQVPREALSETFDGLKWGCPKLLGGSAGLTIKLQGGGDAALATCGNGCKASSTLSFDADAAFELCSGKAWTVKGKHVASSDIQTAKACDSSSCSTVCDPSKSCETNTETFSLSAGPRFDYQVGWGKSLMGGLFTVGAVCTGKADVNIGGNYSGKAVTNTNFPGACVGCNEKNVAATIDITAKGGCSVAMNIRRRKAPITTTVGCTDCLKLTVSESFGVLSKSGACGTKTCNSSSVAASASIAGGPALCTSVFGRKAKVKFGGTAGGKCTASGCSTGAQTCTNESKWDMSVVESDCK